jgi:uncharacterized membrane protein
MEEKEKKDEEEINAVSSTKIKVRIDSLSDLVFGLALSIGSLDFLSNPAKNAYDLESNIALFAFSFAILVFTWLGYSRTMAVISQENDAMVYISLVLLFFVAIEPYLFYVLVTSTTTELADVFSAAYALDVGSMFLIQAGLAYLILRDDKKNTTLQRKRLHPAIIARFRRALIGELVVGILYLSSALPIFWVRIDALGQEARFVLWWSSFAIFFVIRGSGRRAEKNRAKTPEIIK